MAEDEFIEIPVCAAIAENVFYAISDAFVPRQWFQVYRHVNTVQFFIFLEDNLMVNALAVTKHEFDIFEFFFFHSCVCAVLCCLKCVLFFL